MKRGYFLLIDTQKNTVCIPTDDTFIHDVLTNEKVIKHKTKSELNQEISIYLKGGSTNEEDAE